MQGPHAAGQTHQPRVARQEDVVVPIENRIDEIASDELIAYMGGIPRENTISWIWLLTP